ncbi:hypothetical protein [Acidiphilium sp.]|uniref:hypothetical protein n=1 Tax=Acidiphilium sp. TaxID=527 RepID=UPI002585FA24|nr:hypothetical protein [Acidiphilium sp.]
MSRIAFATLSLVFTPPAAPPAARQAARQADEAGAFPASLIERAWALGLMQAATGEGGGTDGAHRLRLRPIFASVANRKYVIHRFASEQSPPEIRL